MAQYRDYDSQEETPGPRPLTRLLMLIGVGFAAGMVLMGWLLTSYGSALGIGGDEAAPAPAPVTIAARERADPAPADPVEAIDPSTEGMPIEARLDALESRITRLHSNATTAVGNTDRAEGLLVAFAARRALDRGIALGYIESVLRERFGRAEPRAVAVVISASRQPVTLDGLQARLAEIAPLLTGRAPDEGWWDVVRREASELFVLRQAGTPSPAPSDRLQRARDKLEAGQVDSALAEVLRLPGQEAAAEWIAEARRYVAARNALDRIETIALMEPRIAERREQEARTEAAQESESSAREAHGESRN